MTAAYAPRVALVTGGAGFIGSNLVRWLLNSQPGLRVVNYDALTYAGNLESLADVFAAHGAPGGGGASVASVASVAAVASGGDGRHYFVRGDVADAEAMAAVMAGRAKEAGTGRVAPAPDVVLHLAAESHVDRSILGAAPFVQTNVVGTQVLLDAIRTEAAERPLRLVHVGTDEVYGSLTPSESPWTEESPLLPNSPYAASKAAADCLVRAWHHTYGLHAVITRCGNNYGPYQFPEKLIPLATTRAFAGEDIPVYGDGLQVRDWIHVVDHARAIWHAALHGRSGEVYNVGGGTQRTNRDVLTELMRHVGASERLLRTVTDRLGHDRRYALDGAKLARETGWASEIPFDRGLADTVAWYRANTAWWERVRSEAYRTAEALYL
jgi:dTDP-glucose 4,6-dehydratase